MNIKQLIRIRDYSGEWRHKEEKIQRERESGQGMSESGGKKDLCNKNANPVPENRMTIDSNYIFPL